MHKVAVAILNWNGKNYLERFLPTLIEHSSGEGVGIYVIDNASTDTSVVFLQENYPSISIIPLDTNYGFAGGYNRGIEHINSEYIVLLNSDIEVTPNWIEPIISYMDSHKSTAICMPKIKDYNNKEYFEYAGAAGGFIDLYGYPFCNGRLFNSIQKDTGQFNTIKEVFWASGAAMFVKKEAYTRIGGLDADFFAHMEEIDICWRAKNMGYSVMYIPTSTVYHVGGGTLPKENPFKTYLNFRNNLFLLYKNLPQSKLRTIIILRMLLDGIAFFMFLFSGKSKDAKAVLKAHKDFYAAKKSLKEKRNQFSKIGLFSYHPEVYLNSIVYDYFIKRKKEIIMK